MSIFENAEMQVIYGVWYSSEKPIIIAAIQQTNDPEIFRKILENKNLPTQDIISESNLTPLAFAIKNNKSFEIIHLIGESQPKSIRMCTLPDLNLPIHWALCQKPTNINTIKYLLQCFPESKSSKNNKGNTPYQVAKIIKNHGNFEITEEIIQLLEPVAELL